MTAFKSAGWGQTTHRRCYARPILSDVPQVDRADSEAGGVDLTSATEVEHISHQSLVQAASHWLRNRRKCVVIVTEMVVSALRDVPDAIGWTGGWYGDIVIQVECKISRQDFRAESKKRNSGLGNERWYFTPPGLLKKEEISNGYGLIEVIKAGRYWKFKTVVRGKPFKSNTKAEVYILLSVIRRGRCDFTAKYYEVPVINPRATITVCPIQSNLKLEE